MNFLEEFGVEPKNYPEFMIDKTEDDQWQLTWLAALYSKTALDYSTIILYFRTKKDAQAAATVLKACQKIDAKY